VVSFSRSQSINTLPNLPEKQIIIVIFGSSEGHSVE
jgi:hypothetical protein